jgi:tetratricopeptide (TPR) repeat protein
MTAKILAPAAALAIAAGIAPAAHAAPACQFQKIAEVPVTMQGTRPTIMVKLNGQDAKFLLDTGAFFGGVTPEAAATYKMKRSTAPFGMMSVGAGGQTRDLRAVSADTFNFAGVGFHDVQFTLVPRVGGAGIVGIIGENMMGPFDVEYDLANGIIRYFKPVGCGYEANLAYWSAGMALSRVPIIDPTSLLTTVIVSAKVDGHSIKVQLDSGASLSTLNQSAAARAGMQITSAGAVSRGLTYGVQGRGIETFQAPFSSFKIGDEEIKNTRLMVSDLNMANSDMLLGADFFLSHRILISNSQKKVYFTYNGGPVFRLEQGLRQQTVQAEAPAARPDGAVPTATAPAPGGEEPKTAAEFARRAAAEAARRELQPAIADYSKAIELEPDNGAHYRARAMIRLAARQPVLAMADLDESLKRRPDDPEALMRRGELYLASKDLARAKTDFDQATKLAPDNPDLAPQVGAAYVRSGQYELAIQEMDSWIAAHPKAEDLPRAQNARCYARAAWGKQLEAALADCDAAMRKDKTSSVMENRALVLLRMGRADDAIAQFGEAIRAQPRSVPALYGRALAEFKKGDKAAGEADLAAAKAISPNAGVAYKRMGLTPDAPSGPPAAG